MAPQKFSAQAQGLLNLGYGKPQKDAEKVKFITVSWDFTDLSWGY
jgi:hypothetical protein